MTTGTTTSWAGFSEISLFTHEKGKWISQYQNGYLVKPSQKQIITIAIKKIVKINLDDVKIRLSKVIVLGCKKMTPSKIKN